MTDFLICRHYLCAIGNWAALYFLIVVRLASFNPCREFPSLLNKTGVMYPVAIASTPVFWKKTGYHTKVSETFKYRFDFHETPLCTTFPFPDWSTSSFFSCLIGSFMRAIGKLGRLIFRSSWNLVRGRAPDNSAL